MVVPHLWPAESLVGRPELELLARLIAMADTDKIARLRLRLRLLRALHDLCSQSRCAGRPVSKMCGLRTNLA